MTLTRERKLRTIKSTLGLTDDQLDAMLAADKLPGEEDKRLDKLYADSGRVLKEQVKQLHEDMEFSY